VQTCSLNNSEGAEKGVKIKLKSNKFEKEMLKRIFRVNRNHVYLLNHIMTINDAVNRDCTIAARLAPLFANSAEDFVSSFAFMLIV